MNRLTFFAGLCVALSQVACGQGDSAPAMSPASPPAKSSAEAKARPKPKVQVPDGSPPNGLVVKNLQEGSGAVIKAGDQAYLHYVGVNYKRGKEFEASWRRTPFTFQFGAGEVLDGWEEGMKGMKVGGRRELIVPSKLAYGTGTLVYVIDLLRVVP
jgi:peptidylprolyl isomerase